MAEISIQNVALVGKIPGYGPTLDKGNTYGNILLRDVTYIDLIPATYSINTAMLSQDGNLNDFYLYSSGLSKSSTYKIFNKVIEQLGDYALKQFNTGLKTYSSGFDENQIKLIGDYAEKITNTWKKSTSIRILAANDSTFTETISNTFMDNNSGSNIMTKATQAFDKAMPTVNKVLGGENLISKLQNMSYSSALDALTSASTHSGIASLLTGKVLGVQFATPNVWQSSSYNSTLNIFIKLASPSGDPLSIYKFITLPILTMMAAGSPITINGVTYAMPLIWDVRAYGITHYKIGAVAAMTISRGSYETVFNSAKQPLLVDVRLTIIPLMQDFAVQYSGDNTGTIGQTIDLAVDATATAATTITDAATTNSIGESIANVFKELDSLFSSISANAQQTISSGNDGKNIYGGNGLGVQSPGDEIDGLMGINYEGPAGISPREEIMKMEKYDNMDSEPNYVKGFANSYIFKI